MKKSMIAMTLAVAVAFGANAQKLDASKVPTTVKESFVKHYPGIKTKWEKEGDKYEAGFKKDGKTMSALFDVNGMMTESEVDIKVAELPTVVLHYVREHYKGKTIKEAAKITKADGTVNFEAEVNGKDVLFDEAGKFLKEVKD
ncbi:MAG: PepSY-like domain-containing protein [Bacteroidetes bacterium]|nr:PepSY-like domain-containing protein [Bacteroidota bacterium]